MTKVRELYKSRYGMVPQSIVEEEDAAFLGMGKKAREARAQKREDKQAHKIEKAKVKAEGRALVASKGGGLAGLGAGLGSVVNNLLGKSGAEEMPIPAGGDAAGGGAAPAASNSKKYILIGVVAIAIVIVVVVLVKRKKKAS